MCSTLRAFAGSGVPGVTGEASAWFHTSTTPAAAVGRVGS